MFRSLVTNAQNDGQPGRKHYAFDHSRLADAYRIVSVQLHIYPLIATLKPQSNGPSYSNTVIGTLAVDGWAVTFGTACRGQGGAAARPGPSSL